VQPLCARPGGRGLPLQFVAQILDASPTFRRARPNPSCTSPAPRRPRLRRATARCRSDSRPLLHLALELLGLTFQFVPIHRLSSRSDMAPRPDPSRSGASAIQFPVSSFQFPAARTETGRAGSSLEAGDWRLDAHGGLGHGRWGGAVPQPPRDNRACAPRGSCRYGQHLRVGRDQRDGPAGPARQRQPDDGRAPRRPLGHDRRPGSPRLHVAASRRYTVSASKPGHITVSYGQRQAGVGRPGTAIQLSDGQKFEVRLQLPRGVCSPDGPRRACRSDAGHATCGRADVRTCGRAPTCRVPTCTDVRRADVPRRATCGRADVPRRAVRADVLPTCERGACTSHVARDTEHVRTSARDAEHVRTYRTSHVRT